MLINAKDRSKVGKYEIEFQNPKISRILKEGEADYRTVSKGEYRNYTVLLPSQISDIKQTIISFDILNGNSVMDASQIDIPNL